jgi:hypothetical protein
MDPEQHPLGVEYDVAIAVEMHFVVVIGVKL